MGCHVWFQGRDNMDSGLSPQDKKDLDKFIKFFALKVRVPALLFPAPDVNVIVGPWGRVEKPGVPSSSFVSSTSSVSLTSSGIYQCG